MVQDNFDYKKKFSEICSKFDLKISAERELNVDRNLLGELAKKSCPRIIHAFISPKKNNDTENLEAIIFKIKKYLDNNFCAEKELYCVSFSAKTIVYKGLVHPDVFSKFLF